MEKLGLPVEKYSGQLFRVVSQKVLLPSGKKVEFESVERTPGVRVIVTHGKNNILITKEWRIEINNWDYRLPGGKIFDDLSSYVSALENQSFDINQVSVLAAQRELKEETGLLLNLSDITKHYVSIDGATVKWDLYYFLAKSATKDIPFDSINTAEGENIQNITWFSFDDVLNLCLNNLIREDRTAAVLMRYILSHAQYGKRE